MQNLTHILGLLILDKEGERIIANYNSNFQSTPKNIKKFEKELFQEL